MRQQAQIAYLLPPSGSNTKPEILYAPTLLWNKFNNPKGGPYIFDTFIQFINLSPDAGNVDFTSTTLVHGSTFEKGFDGGFSNNLAYKQVYGADQNTGNVYPPILTYLSSGNDNGNENTSVKINARVSTNATSGDMSGAILASIDYPFVANYQQYISGGIYNGPKGEPGFYLVALVGSVKSTDPATQARIVVMKRSM